MKFSFLFFLFGLLTVSIQASQKPNEVPLPPYFPETKAHRASWTEHYNAVRGADAQVEGILAQLKADG